MTFIEVAASGSCTTGLIPPMMVLAEALIWGSPRPIPVSVSLTDNGIGNTGCG